MTLEITESSHRLAVLCASYNRIDVTLRGLHSLHECLARVDGVRWKLFLLDDSSPDGTAEIVRRTFPEVEVIDGTGHLYWNRGMCAAYSVAYKYGPWDSYLLYNDDCEIIPGMVEKLFLHYFSANSVTPTAYVGAFRSKNNGAHTYGGYRRKSSMRPLLLELVKPSGEDRRCDTFNGNFVVIPGPFFDAVGGLNPAFHHGYGDTDLGYLLARRGVALVVFSDTIGYAERNVLPDRSSLKHRWASEFSAPNSFHLHALFLWRNGNKILWPISVTIAFVLKLKRTILP